MVKKKLDNRIRTLIENCVTQNHRSMFVIVGNKGRDQVVILHHILTKASVKARPSVLWCYKKDLGFTSNRKKRMRQINKKMKSTGNVDINEENPFELFISATQIRYCYYNETHSILGNTFGMCVLQDFEALTPNLLARTIETVEGGGMVVLLLNSMASLRQLYTMTMDVHARYRGERNQDVVGRFNERFILSLANCSTCVVTDDSLNVLPISLHSLNIERLPPKQSDELSPSEVELKELKESLQDSQPIGSLVNCCKTLDQARAVLKFLDAVTEKTLQCTVSLTAARGRGKSAALGLAIAGAVAFGYSNIFVTAPSPENIKTLIEFILKGFDAINFQEHIDYELIQSNNPEFNKAVVRVNVFRDHRQTIQYIHPTDAEKLGQAELVVIDEAAAIPLPFVKELFGPHLVFMASTINGYEGTGRSLSLKLLQQLREQSSGITGTPNKAGAKQTAKDAALVSSSGRKLHETTLDESIRYAPGDKVEAWLNTLLCLDVNISRSIGGCPSPADCELYYINRDTLFCYHKASETFLQRLMAIYVSAHYKNTPNDLQMISDAPAHHLFCLLGPVDPQKASSLPEILCVIQVCMEGEISRESILSNLSRGKRSAGDLIPWTISQQFQDDTFPGLSGARIVRIATHPEYQSMGYGTRALQLLQEYYEGKIPFLTEEDVDQQPDFEVDDTSVGLLDEKISPRRNLPPLLAKLTERRAERLDWLGVSYGITSNLLKYWKRNGYVPVYLRQTTNNITGEHSCIMLKLLNTDQKKLSDNENWLLTYWKDFRRRFTNLLSYEFSRFHPTLALAIINHKHLGDLKEKKLTRRELTVHLQDYDMQRLDAYSMNLTDFHLIMDLFPTLAKLYFLKKISIDLNITQTALLLGLGLQHKSLDQMTKELNLTSMQLLGLLVRAMRKIYVELNMICEKAAAKELGDTIAERQKVRVNNPNTTPLDKELDQDAEVVNQKLRENHEKLMLMPDDPELSAFAIRGTEDDWGDALESASKSKRGKVNGVTVKRKAPLTPNDSRATPESFALDGMRKKKRKTKSPFKK